MANSKIKRKEVCLSTEVIKKLQVLATKDNRLLKNYMEKVLSDHVAPEEHLSSDGISQSDKK